MASHGDVESQGGMGGWIRFWCTKDSVGDEYTNFQSFTTGQDYSATVGGRVTTSGENDLKYILVDIGGSGSITFTDNSSCVIYTVKYS